MKDPGLETSSRIGSRGDPEPELARQAEKGGTGRSLAFKLIVGALVLTALYFAARQAGGYIPAFAEWVDGLGVWGPLVFALGYAAATVVLIPGSLLTLAGGAIFGLVQGTITVFLGATLGATAAFIVSRYLARRPIERKIADHPRFGAIDRAVSREGRKIVFLLRLTPIFPFVFLNYALGLTRVKLVDYVVASVGMLPGTLLYVYYGKVAGDVATLAAGAPKAERGWQYYAVLVLGVLATLAVTTYVTRLARRALSDLES